MMHQVSHGSLLHAVAVIVFASQLAAGQAGSDSFIGGERVRQACAFATAQGYSGKPLGSPAQILAAFCALRSPASDSAWGSITVPAAADVINAANGVRISEIPAAVRANGAAAGISEAFGMSALPSQGLLLVGFTQFATNEAKVAVTTYMVNRFAKGICKEKLHMAGGPKGHTWDVTDSLQTFLPGTCTLLATGTADKIVGPGYGLPSWGIVRASLRDDADKLPDMLIGRFRTYGALAYADLPNNATLAGPAQRVMALVGTARLANTYVRKRDVPQAFRDAAADLLAFANAVCPSAQGGPRCTLNWRQMPIARGMMVAAATIGAISPEDFKAAGTNSAQLADATLLGLKALAVNLRAGDDVINPFLTEAFNDFLAEKGMGGGGVTNHVPFNAKTFFQIAEPLVEAAATGNSAAAAKAADTKLDRTAVVTAYADALLDVAPQLLSVTADISTADAQAVTHVVERLARYPGMRIKGSYSALISDVMTLSTLVAGGIGYQELRDVAVPAAVIRTTQFVVDASETTDADGFQKVIETYAAGPSAFMHKRTAQPNASPFYWSLNTYVGAAIGQETAYGKGLSIEQTARYSGLAIPVGIEFGITGHGAWGVLFQVADVGQVASWRSHQDASSPVKATPPSLTLASVFAPGANFVWNLPSIPLAIGTGVARAPQFRDLTNVPADAVAEPKANTWRWTVFAAIDVPIIP